MSAIAAAPKYKIGDEVFYRDHQSRLQTGFVKRIEASWNGYGREETPLIIYTLSHPTYHRNKHYASENRVLDRVIHVL